MSASDKRDEKRARLELRLRENLKRRKDQARARRDADVEERDAPESTPEPDERD